MQALYINNNNLKRSLSLIEEVYGKYLVIHKQDLSKLVYEAKAEDGRFFTFPSPEDIGDTLSYSTYSSTSFFHLWDILEINNYWLYIKAKQKQ